MIRGDKLNSLKSDNQLDPFLYEKCCLIDIETLEKMNAVQEYVQALNNYDGELNDKVIYNILRGTYIQMAANGSAYRIARDVLNRVSAEVTGYSGTWCKGIDDAHSRYGFLFKKSMLNKSKLYDLLFLPEFVQELDRVMEFGHGIEDVDIYNIVKKLYFPMLKNYQTEGFKQTFKLERGTQKYKIWSYHFRILGQATRKFSSDLFDEDRWEQDFNTFMT